METDDDLHISLSSTPEQAPISDQIQHNVKNVQEKSK